MINKSSNSKGFAILYAVLMVSIVLTISLTLLDISYKQLILSSINEESKLAYYAAVSALNCVTYWDTTFSTNAIYAEGYFPFGHFIPPDLNLQSGNPKPIVCAGETVTADVANQIYSFSLSFSQAGRNTKADVRVIQGNGNNGAPSGQTKIEVDGYNTDDPNNPRRLQRSLDSS